MARLVGVCHPVAGMTCCDDAGGEAWYLASCRVPWAAAAGFAAGGIRPRPLPDGGTALASWAKRDDALVPGAAGERSNGWTSKLSRPYVQALPGATRCFARWDESRQRLVPFSQLSSVAAPHYPVDFDAKSDWVITNKVGTMSLLFADEVLAPIADDMSEEGCTAHGAPPPAYRRLHSCLNSLLTLIPYVPILTGEFLVYSGCTHRDEILEVHIATPPRMTRSAHAPLAPPCALPLISHHLANPSAVKNPMQFWKNAGFCGVSPRGGREEHRACKRLARAGHDVFSAHLQVRRASPFFPACETASRAPLTRAPHFRALPPVPRLPVPRSPAPRLLARLHPAVP